MGYGHVFLVFFNFILVFISIVQATYSEETYNSKYEYKYSFKGPNLYQPGLGIPFWNHSFDAVPGADQVRVVPSLRTKYGAVWSKQPFTSDQWKVEISFRINGRGSVGADGFVFWYVETPSVYGPVFGSKDRWNGLGVFFDSYDNDGKKNNPYIYAIYNNGTQSYHHNIDGSDQMQGGCFRDFRNKPYPVKARIIYAEEQLEIYIDNGNSPTEEYDFCASMDVTIPNGYHFGISAATGALADDHDILKFLTWSLSKKTADDKPEVIDEEQKKKEDEMKRLQEEYDKNLQDFYSEQKKFIEEHPDKVKEDVGSPEDLFQGGSSAELKAVFDVQSTIKSEVRALTKTILTVLEKQEQMVSKINEVQPPDVDLAKAHQVKEVQDLQKTAQETLLELRNNLNFLKASTSNVAEGVSKLGANAGVAKPNVGNPYESQKQMTEIGTKLDSIHTNLLSMEQKQNGQNKTGKMVYKKQRINELTISCPTLQDGVERSQARMACPEPEQPSCVSSVVLVLIAALQVIIIIGYHTFKQSREDAAKKFF